MKLPKLYLLLLVLAAVSCGKERVAQSRPIDEHPEIFPDYIGVTVPSSIAPLNFVMSDDNASLIDVTISDNSGNSINSQGSESSNIDPGKWSQMLKRNEGATLQVAVSAKYDDGWRTFKPFEIYVSPDSIDYGLAYRLIAPGYEVYSHMGIYQRSLSDYCETPILENTQVEGCMNCHSFNHCDPKHMQLHVRGPHAATMIRKDGKMQMLDTKTDSTLAACVYPYWHPTGKYVAYSTNETRQAFHTGKDKRIEVFDYASDLQVLDTETNTLLVPDILRVDSIWETFPAFSPDGKSLYFCAASAKPASALKDVRYNLCRIDFDPDRAVFGTKIDTLVYAESIGKSVSFPRPSFDGRHLMYTLADYGNFSIWHLESDLHLLDLASGQSHALDKANSDDAESYHNWSSNSRWFVFGSRRNDGLHTQAYICHIDADGNADKPFLLPQENPRKYYDSQFRSYNIPEFITRPVNLDRMQASKLLHDDTRTPLSVKIQK